MAWQVLSSGKKAASSYKTVTAVGQDRSTNVSQPYALRSKSAVMLQTGARQERQNHILDVTTAAEQQMSTQAAAGAASVAKAGRRNNTLTAGTAAHGAVQKGCHTSGLLPLNW